MNIDTRLRFQPGVTPPSNREGNDLWFAFYNNRLLIKNTNGFIIPNRDDIDRTGVKILRSNYIGVLDGCNCYSAELADEVLEDRGFSLKEMRPLLGVIEDELFSVVGKAYQIMLWDRDHQYCGRCGAVMVAKKDERAKVCPKCGLLNYPRISPAIIVAIRNNNKLLLAHNKNFRGGMYSVIAGFVEPGETFEECVMREVYEEVGISVKNIKYFASQPWPFPQSLMIGFTAEYESGEINVDGVEIESAGWFAVHEFPSVPPKESIAGKLIDAFRNSISE